MVLEQYPDDVVIYITDPRTGVQRHAKWPPTISEVIAACDERIAYKERMDRFRNWGYNEPLLEAPTGPKPTYEELKNKYGKNFGLNPDIGKVQDDFKSKTWEQITDIYQSKPGRINELAALLPKMRMEDETLPKSEDNPFE